MKKNFVVLKQQKTNLVIIIYNNKKILLKFTKTYPSLSQKRIYQIFLVME